MGKKLETFLSETLCNIGLYWWEAKIEEFKCLPYLSENNQSVYFFGKIEEFNVKGEILTSEINVKFSFFEFAYDSEKHFYELDSALRLTQTGTIYEETIIGEPGLVKVKHRILKSVFKVADNIIATYDFKVFIDRILALIKDELDENSGIVDSEEYRKLLEHFYCDLEFEISTKYKYKYDASESLSPPNYQKFPLKLNIEQLSALATYLSSVSKLTKSQRLDLFAHFSNVFEIWDKKKHKSVELKQIHSAYRKIQMKKHEGAGLKEILHSTNKIIDSINSGKSNDFLDIK